MFVVFVLTLGCVVMLVTMFIDWYTTFVPVSQGARPDITVKLTQSDVSRVRQFPRNPRLMTMDALRAVKPGDVVIMSPTNFEVIDNLAFKVWECAPSDAFSIMWSPALGELKPGASCLVLQNRLIGDLETWYYVFAGNMVGWIETSCVSDVITS